MRDNIWLEKKIKEIWGLYFVDIKRLNDINIHFGRKAKRRLASIRQKNRYNKQSDTEIKVTGYFKDERVPEFVVDVTIAHELCHYAHGFASPLPQFSKFPHRGDLVDNELITRGLGEELKNQEKWLENNWNGIVNDEIYRKKHHYKRKRKSQSPIFAFLEKLVLNS